MVVATAVGTAPATLTGRLRQGPCFGTFLKLGRPEVADMLALAGSDFAICDMEHAQMTEIEEAAARHGTIMGIFAKDVAAARRYLAAGYRYLAVSGDAGLLMGAARDMVARLREAREELAAPAAGSTTTTREATA